MNGNDIHDELLSRGYSDNFIEQLYEREIDERLALKQQEDKQNEKVYNNEALEEQIYQSLLHYPIRRVPIKDRPGVLLGKVIGIVKRGLLNRNTKLLSAKNYSEHNEHEEFVYRIADLSLYNENKFTLQNSNPKTIRRDENSVENNR